MRYGLEAYCIGRHIAITDIIINNSRVGDEFFHLKRSLVESVLECGSSETRFLRRILYLNSAFCFYVLLAVTFERSTILRKRPLKTE